MSDISPYHLSYMVILNKSVIDELQCTMSVICKSKVNNANFSSALLCGRYLSRAHIWPACKKGVP